MPTEILPGITSQEIVSAQSIWREQPLKLIYQMWPGKLWLRQEEICGAIAKYPKVAVKSGNTIGKSHLLSKIVLWFLLTYYPSKVITTAPTFNQIENILWKEIATLFYKSKIPIGGSLLNTELKLNNDWFALGISTDEVNRFQGFHSPHLLVVIDEALGVDPMIWEAIEGLHPYKVLAIGNPLVPEGEFFKCFSNPLWHKITVSCEECVKWQADNQIIPGLVTKQWIDERRQEWGISSPLYQSRVLGEFPQEGSDTLVSLKWMDWARKNVLEIEDDALKILATDVARYGEDKTVFCKREDHVINEFIVKEKIPTTMTAGIVKRQYEISGVDNLGVDDSGVGGGVTDILTEQHIGVLAFNGGCRALPIDKVHFKNLRSQFYWILARKLEKKMIDLTKIEQSHFETLKNQICSIKYSIESDGKIKVESKDDMKARGLSSPDLADALMISEYCFFKGRVGEVASYAYR